MRISCEKCKEILQDTLSSIKVDRDEYYTTDKIK